MKRIFSLFFLIGLVFSGNSAFAGIEEDKNNACDYSYSSDFGCYKWNVNNNLSIVSTEYNSATGSWVGFSCRGYQHIAANPWIDSYSYVVNANKTACISGSPESYGVTDFISRSSSSSSLSKTLSCVSGYTIDKDNSTVAFNMDRDSIPNLILEPYSDDWGYNYSSDLGKIRINNRNDDSNDESWVNTLKVDEDKWLENLPNLGSSLTMTCKNFDKCAMKAKITCVPNIVPVDLIAIEKNNLSYLSNDPTPVSPNHEVNTDFEIGVVGCYYYDAYGTCISSGASRNLEGKTVKFSVEYDAEFFGLDDYDNFNGTEDSPRLHPDSTNWGCFPEISGTNTTIECSADSHGALDNGITDTPIFDKFDFTTLSTATGNSEIIFKTWTTSGDIVDAGSNFSTGSNNIKTLYFKVPTADLSAMVVNSSDDEFIGNVSSTMGTNFSVRTKIENHGFDMAEDVEFTVSYDSEYLKWKSAIGWIVSGTEGNYTFTKNPSLNIPSTGTNYLIPSLVFEPIKIGNTDITYTVSSETSDLSPDNNTDTVNVSIFGVGIKFANGTNAFVDLSDEKSIDEDIEGGAVNSMTWAFTTSSYISDAKFELCNNSGDNAKFEIDLSYNSLIKKDGVSFDYEDTSNLDHEYQICVKVLDHSDTVMGTSNLTVRINDVNEKPADDDSVETGDVISVPYGATTEITKDLLKLFSNNPIDPDTGDGNASLIISGISTSKTRSIVDTNISISGNKGKLEFNVDEKKIYFESNASGLDTQNFWYTICDNGELCGVRKIQIQVNAGSGCENPFGEGTIDSGNGFSQLSRIASPQLGCEKNITISCDNGSWKEGDNVITSILEKYVQSYLCTVDSQPLELEDSLTPFQESSSDSREDFFVGQTFQLQPTIPVSPEISNSGETFTGNIQVSFDKTLFAPEISGTGWNCTEAGTQKTCTKSITYNGTTNTSPLTLKVIGDPENSEDATITYSASDFAEALQISDKEIFLKTNPQTLVQDNFSGMQNELGVIDAEYGSLQVLGISGAKFSVVSNNKCDTTVSDTISDYIGLSEISGNYRINIKKLFDTDSKIACIKISGADDLILGYDTVTVAVESEKFLVFLPESDYENALPENTVDNTVIGVISGEGLTALELSSDSAEIYSIEEITTKPDDKTITVDISTVAEINIVRNNTNHGMLVGNIVSGSVNLRNAIAQKTFATTLPEISDTQKYYNITLKKGFNYEEFTIKTRIIEVTGTFPEGTLEKTFELLLEDINEAPQEISPDYSDSIGSSETKILNFSDLGVDDTTDPDEADDKSALTIEGIYVGDTVPEISGAWATLPITSTETGNEYEITISGTEENEISVKNTDASGSLTIHYKLCDNNSDTVGDSNNIPKGIKQNNGVR